MQKWTKCISNCAKHGSLETIRPQRLPLLCHYLTNLLHQLQANQAFVEFGSGRGQLTYWIVKATKDYKNVRYFLIDKESHRHKFDNKLKDEVPEAEVQRIRADIQNLVLEKVPGIAHEASVSFV